MTWTAFFLSFPARRASLRPSSVRPPLPPRSGGGVADDRTVEHSDDAGRIFLRELRVMGHHDNQAFLCDLLEDFHDLNAGFGVQRQWVRQQG